MLMHPLFFFALAVAAMGVYSSSMHDPLEVPSVNKNFIFFYFFIYSLISKLFAESF
jgi:hypothetical protein